MVTRISICVFLLVYALHGNTQTKLATTVNSYTESQKRLLAKNIGRLLHVASQGQWDLDSGVLFACKTYGLNKLFPYDEMIGSPAINHETKLLGDNRVNEVIQSLAKVGADRKIRTLLELAIYYLHKPGSNIQHLDSAATFIKEARGAAAGANKWDIECDALLGEYHYQKGDQRQSDQYFAAIVNNLAQGADKKRLAIAWHQLALHLSPFDTARIRYLEKAFSAFQQLKLNEHAIEVLSDIVTFYFMSDWKRAEIKLKEVLALQKETGYKHTMDVYFVLSYLKSIQSEYLPAIAYTDSCVSSMTTTGDSIIYSWTCLRTGEFYAGLEEWGKAYNWYMKGIQRRQREPRLFWYTNLFQLFLPAIQLQKDLEYISLLLQILSEQPPQGSFDSLRLYQCLSSTYDRVGDTKMADKYFNMYVDKIEKQSPEHQQVTTLFVFTQIAAYYIKRKQYSLARSYLNRTWPFLSARRGTGIFTEIYYQMYRLDSLEGKYHDALLNYRKYRLHIDTLYDLNQRFKAQELNVLYETEKKDQDIKLLTQQGLLHQSELKHATQSRNLILGGATLLLIIAALLYNQYRFKQKNAKLIEQKNTKLVQLVDEKEWLLKEVHHRVKNNLQTVVSLLELQSEYLSNDALAAIQASQNRIHATSLLHQKLYQDENVSSINMNSYLPELIHYLKEVYNIKNNIHFKVNIEPIDLDVSQAIPVGLIVNEAITNSIKYAFRHNTDKAEVAVCFTKSNGIAELLIADNGGGFIVEGEKNLTGLGLKLVKGLAEDIDGYAEITSVKGTKVLIHFAPRSTLASIARRKESAM